MVYWCVGSSLLPPLLALRQNPSASTVSQWRRTTIQVVATKVGGVPEVLPPDMLIFSECNGPSLAHAVLSAIPKLPEVNPQEFHHKVARMYSWQVTTTP